MQRLKKSRYKAIALAIAIIATVTVLPAMAAHKYAGRLKPVHHVSSDQLNIGTPDHPALLPYYASTSLDRTQPNIRRVVIVLHGKLRNADQYFDTLRQAVADSGVNADNVLLIAPQLLASVDVEPNHLSPAVLNWSGNDWMAGIEAAGPEPLSSFAALDGLLGDLANREKFPHITDIVMAGHSGGAQVLQRFAMATGMVKTLSERGIRIHFLLSSPSSYAYFDEQRPVGDATPQHAAFARFTDNGCPNFNDWKYGMERLPHYIDGMTPQALEQRYLQRDVTYMVGGNDNDPQHPALDKTCPAEAQGSQRVARASAYVAYLAQRHPTLPKPAFFVIPGVGHDERRMLSSPPAVRVLFGLDPVRGATSIVAPSSLESSSTMASDNDE